MNDQDKQQQSTPDIKSQLKKFKFMTNIVKGAMHQTRYMKSLEKVTMDAQVSYNRLFMSLGAGFVCVIAYFMFTFNGAKTAYVFIPATLMLVAAFITLVNYLISSRTKSMLVTAAQLAIHPFIENTRRKSKKLGDLKSLGIEKFDKGVIKFTEGDYGVIYRINGVLSLSALPSTANAVADAKLSYLVGRPASAQESMIVSVIDNNTDKQQINLSNYYKNANSGSYGDLWIRAMAKKTQDIINTRMAGEYKVVEHLIIRDDTIMSLKKAITNFENAVNGNGLYASYDRLMSRQDVVKALAPIGLLSKKGQIIHGKD